MFFVQSAIAQQHMTTDMSLDISIGFFSSPDTAAYPGFGDGGIRISVNGFVLTRYNTSYDGFERYDASGNQLENTEEYVGKFLDIMMEEPGDSAVVLSFCDGEHARIACQPISAPDSYDFPPRSRLGTPSIPTRCATNSSSVMKNVSLSLRTRMVDMRIWMKK